jgi:hypothetical protein
MTRHRSFSATPLAAVGRGLLAGAAGTTAMTAVQLAYLKAKGQEPSTTPAQVGKRLIEGVLQREVPESRMGLLNNAMHFLYGTSWAAIYGLAQESLHLPTFRHGILFGTLVWSASLVELPAMKLAPPVWEYAPATLASDVGFHLVYGSAVAAAHRALLPS